MKYGSKSKTRDAHMMVLQHSSEKLPTLACYNNYYVQCQSRDFCCNTLSLVSVLFQFESLLHIKLPIF